MKSKSDRAISSDPADDYRTEYGWDHRNRLTRVTFKDNSGAVTKLVETVYDVFDRRIGKRVDSDGDGVFDRYERFVYDGEDVVLDFLDPDGEGTDPLVLATRYLQGPAVDQILAQEDVATSAVLWQLTDNLGSVRDLVDSSGDLVAHYVYDSFGNLVDGADGQTRYLYTGREWDADIGLQYNRARWYDPKLGRWLSEDPIGFEAGDANVGRYVGNRSTTWTDPTGLHGPYQITIAIGHSNSVRDYFRKHNTRSLFATTLIGGIACHGDRASADINSALGSDGHANVVPQLPRLPFNLYIPKKKNPAIMRALDEAEQNPNGNTGYTIPKEALRAETLGPNTWPPPYYVSERKWPRDLPEDEDKRFETYVERHRILMVAYYKHVMRHAMWRLQTDPAWNDPNAKGWKNAAVNFVFLDKEYSPKEFFKDIYGDDFECKPRTEGTEYGNIDWTFDPESNTWTAKLFSNASQRVKKPVSKPLM